MSEFSTEQESFWAGEFGDQYIGRNQGENLIASNTAFFRDALKQTRDIGSVIEFGPNVGMNLYAIHNLLPDAALSGVEINSKAAETLRGYQDLKVDVHEGSILEYQPDRVCDFAFTKTVLIHINPDELPKVYERLYQSTSRYLLVAEYYNPAPMVVPYRGNQDRLFKRDFAGEIMDQYPDLKLLDYQFVYHRDPNFPADDITWFLMEKKS